VLPVLAMIGRTLLHYTILEKLGEGGMGVVYKARDTRLARLVAIKVLPPEATVNAERKHRFMQEARTAASLNHANIVTVHDIAEAEGVLFIAMEYIAGKTLHLQRCLYAPHDKGAILKGQGGRRPKQPTFTFAQAG
jgi:serine/threonine protein kinase